MAEIWEGKWWAWQGLNLRPLRCQGRDTSLKPQKTAFFGVPLTRMEREQMRNCGLVYRSLTAQVLA